MCVPTGGVIDPRNFPVPTASPATLERQARDLRREGSNVAGIGGDIKSAWEGLSSCYFAPEAETLYAVVNPVATDGDKVETSFDKAASALETFAEAVRDIQAKWTTLTSDAYTFRNSIEGDDDWREADGFVNSLLGRESDKVEEHQALLDRADALRREYEAAEIACANAINAEIPYRTDFTAGDGDGESAPGVFEHGYDGYLGDVATAWGGPMETDHGWWIDAGAAVGDFFVGIAEDVGGITGMYSSEGWFEMSWGDAMWEYHEGNLQSLASLAGMYDSENDSWGWSGWDTVGNAWKDAAHAVVPWEEWGERPGYVIGTALLNIGATVGGAVLTATGVGAVVGVPLMAWRGSAMLNRMGGDGAPSAPDVDVPDMSRINLSLPRFGNISLADLRIDLGQLREGAFSTSRLSEMQNLLSRFTGGGFFGGGDGPGGSGNGSGGDGNGNGSEGSNAQSVANHHGDEEGDPANTRPAVHPTTRQLDDSQELLELLTSRPDSVELGDTGRRVLGEQGGDTDAPRPNRPGRSDLEELGLDPSLEAVFSDMNAHASDYPAWEASQTPGGPDSGRVPALVGGGNNDTFEGSQDVPNPPSFDRVNLTGTGADGSRRFPDDHRDADTGNGGPQMRSDTPEVTNRADTTTPRHGDVPESRNSAEVGPVNRHTVIDTSTTSNGGGDRPGGPGDGFGEDGRRLPDPDSGDPDAQDTRRDDDTGSGSDSDSDGTDGSTDTGRPITAERAALQERVRDLLRGRDLGTDEDFVRNFVDAVNTHFIDPPTNKRSLVLEAFYDKRGYRYRTDSVVNGEAIPSLVWDGKNNKWTAREILPPALPPKYLGDAAAGVRAGVPEVIRQTLDKLADVRAKAIEKLKPFNDKVKEYKAAHKENPSASIAEKLAKAREARRPYFRNSTTASEDFGEGAAQQAVRENFDGTKKVWYQELVRDKNGEPVLDENRQPVLEKEKREIRLPRLRESTPENPNPLNLDGMGPGNGNDQFDQIWEIDPEDGGGYVIVEAKSSLKTELGDRVVTDSQGSPKRVSQGSREYFDDILKEMEKQGTKGKRLARKIREAMHTDPTKTRVHYVEAKGNPQDGKYEGNSLRLFDNRYREQIS
ncbi:hypothetical protein [Nocardiopsis synnemataformans]|uniref:hypothetical protein n=1 Tax=Nocardiopsis synnemataformans TaxID=61305 RepID=UPI003EBE8F24